MKASPVDAYNDPGVGEKDVRLLESFYVFIPETPLTSIL